MLRFLTSGESHGKTLIAFLEGLPAGLPVSVDAINEELARRQKGYGRSNRQKIEKDQAQILSGIRHGITTGAPIALLIANRDFTNWEYVMSVEALNGLDEKATEQLEKKSIKQFRPGHADLAGTVKYRHKDIRDVLERSSARETASRVAVGAICEQLLNYFGIRTLSHVIQIQDVRSSSDTLKMPFEVIDRTARNSELFCLDESKSETMKERISDAWQSGDTLGGVVEVIAEGLPVGLGSYTQWDRKLDGRLAQALLSVQAIKAVEFGDGIKRVTNHAGGLEGGMTNGERLVVRAYMKPIPTLRDGLDSLSFPEFQPARAHYERSDVCAVPAASVVCRAMVCIILAEALLEKFGGDNICDVKENLDRFKDYCRDLRRAMGPATDKKVTSSGGAEEKKGT